MGPNDQKGNRKQIVRRRLQSVSGQPQRRRISRIPSPSPPSDEYDLSDDELEAKLRDSFRAEGKRLRDAILREIGGDVRSFVRESLANMSSRQRRRVQSFLNRRFGGRGGAAVDWSVEERIAALEAKIIDLKEQPRANT